MTTDNDVRRAHDLLDELDARAELSQEQETLLRSFLPDLPKQKTLEEIYKYVDDAWLEADDPESKEWLHELHAQMKGLIQALSQPALPAGMRLADHEEYGRCVVSPEMDENNEAYRIFYRSEAYITDSFSCYVETSSLTFIDAEPAAPAHPEVLETEADYENAPEGTIVAADKVSTAWIKTSEAWHSTDGDRSVECPILSVGTRRVLRWGWGK